MLIGHEVQWQKWHFRVGFTPREGLVLYTVAYADQGRERPILYRASLVDMVAPGVYGPIHQHFFNVRLDMMVDGTNNSVYEINTVSDPSGPENPHNNAFHTEATLLQTEAEAQRIIDPLAARYWTIVNSSVRNRLGQSVGYKLMPGENVLPFAREGASVLKRGAFITKHL